VSPARLGRLILAAVPPRDQLADRAHQCRDALIQFALDALDFSSVCFRAPGHLLEELADLGEVLGLDLDWDWPTRHALVCYKTFLYGSVCIELFQAVADHMADAFLWAARDERCIH